MATADSVKEKLQNIIAKANGKTGRTDADVSTSVDSLISGFGQGGGITPTGTKTITENGTHDVAAFASALVNVPVPAQNMVVIPVTLSSALGAGTNKNHSLLTGNDFVKKHYNHEGFCALWVPLTGTTTAAESGVVGAGFHCNRPTITTKSTYYGGFMRSSGATSGATVQVCTTMVNGTGYNISFRATSSGNLNLYVASNLTVPAGDYLLILLCAE